MRRKKKQIKTTLGISEHIPFPENVLSEHCRTICPINENEFYYRRFNGHAHVRTYVHIHAYTHIIIQKMRKRTSLKRFFNLVSNYGLQKTFVSTLIVIEIFRTCSYIYIYIYLNFFLISPIIRDLRNLFEFGLSYFYIWKISFVLFCKPCSLIIIRLATSVTALR